MVTNCKNERGYFLKNTNKRKGFTLIELLAVIVILSLIALIAVPIILNIVNDAKKSAAKDSAYGYIKAIENKVALSLLEDKLYEDKEGYAYNEIKTDVKGIRPTGGLYTLKNGIVTEGAFCIDGYTVIYEDNIARIGESGCNEQSLKLNGSIKLSSNSGSYTYPEIGTFEVIENKSSGKLSCETSDSSIATCSIKDNIVTVKSGTKEGIVTLTIISSSTDKYKEAKAAYVAYTSHGLLSVTANGYTGVYDGKEHGITVTSEKAIIKYGKEKDEDGNIKYELDESPKYTDVGEYTIYYEITRAGYKTVTGSKKVVITKAEGKIELEETSGTIAYKETKEVEIVKNISNGELSVEIANPELVEVSIENNKIVIKGKEKGTTTITVTSKETHNYNRSSVEYDIEVIKANNTLTLSENTKTYTYPTSGTFEVIENTSGGTLSCETSKSKVATCSISGNVVTVVPGKTEGTATLTIKSEATNNYNGAQVAHIAITSKGTLTSYTATGYTGVYDGKTHGITVTSSGSTITYSTDEKDYNSENPKYSDVGEYTVYYKIETEGYNDITGSKKVVITKAEGSLIVPTGKTLTYNGNSQTLINAGSTTTGTIQYKLGNGTYSEELPSATNAGTYTVYYKVVGNKNHNDIAEESINITIKKATLNYTSGGYSGVYDSNKHGITVISEGATIKYGETLGTYNLDESPTLTDAGTKIVYFKITRENYIDVTESEKIEITKANNTLTLSENAKTYTYPTSGTFEIIENTSGGTLSCETNNSNIATCSISGNVVTVKPGTTKGSVTLTIKSAETTNYKEAQVAHVATTEEGILSYTATGYTGVYDGKPHGITVTSSGSTIKYGTSNGSYTETTSPTRTDVGTTKVYYQITKPGYQTVTGSKNIKITPAVPTITYNGGSNTCSWKNNYNLTIISGNGNGISTYEIDVNGDGIADATTGSNFIPSNGWSTCTARFRAVDNDGNRSGWTGNQHIHMDNGAPGATTITYNSGSNTCSWKNNYNISLSASDNVGIAGYDVDWDGDGIANTTTGSNFIPWNGYSSCGTRFRAYDHAGNRGPWSEPQHIHMDTQAPSTPSVSLNGYSSGSWTNGNVQQTASSSDNIGIAYYQYSHDGVNVAGTFPNPWTITWDGQWNFFVRAIDHAGNASGWSSMYTIRRDTIAPSISYSSEAWANNYKDISFSRSDALSGIRSTSCSYGIGNYNSTGTISGNSCIMQGLSAGSTYSYKVTTTDNAGNSNNFTGSFVASGWYNSNPSNTFGPWYYYRNGSKVTGKVDNIASSGKAYSSFYFNSSGVMQFNWIQIGSSWYYAVNVSYTFFESNNTQNNNKQIPNGSLVKNMWVCIPDDNAYNGVSSHYYWYHFNSSGVYDQKGGSCWSGTACLDNLC